MTATARRWFAGVESGNAFQQWPILFAVMRRKAALARPVFVVVFGSKLALAQPSAAELGNHRIGAGAGLFASWAIGPGVEDGGTARILRARADRARGRVRVARLATKVARPWLLGRPRWASLG